MANTLTTEEIIRLADPLPAYGADDLAALSEGNLLGLWSCVRVAHAEVQRQADDLGAWRRYLPGTAALIYHRLRRCHDELGSLHLALAEEVDRRAALGG